MNTPTLTPREHSEIDGEKLRKYIIAHYTKEGPTAGTRSFHLQVNNVAVIAEEMALSKEALQDFLTEKGLRFMWSACLPWNEFYTWLFPSYTDEKKPKKAVEKPDRLKLDAWEARVAKWIRDIANTQKQSEEEKRERQLSSWISDFLADPSVRPNLWFGREIVKTFIKSSYVHTPKSTVIENDTDRFLAAYFLEIGDDVYVLNTEKVSDRLFAREFTQRNGVAQWWENALSEEKRTHHKSARARKMTQWVEKGRIGRLQKVIRNAWKYFAVGIPKSSNGNRHDISGTDELQDRAQEFLIQVMRVCGMKKRFETLVKDQGIQGLLAVVRQLSSEDIKSLLTIADQVGTDSMDWTDRPRTGRTPQISERPTPITMGRAGPQIISKAAKERSEIARVALEKLIQQHGREALLKTTFLRKEITDFLKRQVWKDAYDRLLENTFFAWRMRIASTQWIELTSDFFFSVFTLCKRSFGKAGKTTTRDSIAGILKGFCWERGIVYHEWLLTALIEAYFTLEENGTYTLRRLKKEQTIEPKEARQHRYEVIRTHLRERIALTPEDIRSMIADLLKTRTEPENGFSVQEVEKHIRWFTKTNGRFYSEQVKRLLLREFFERRSEKPRRLYVKALVGDTTSTSIS